MQLDIVSSPERAILDLRKAGFKDVLILGKYHYTYTRKQLPIHQHRQMLEICFCSKGEQTYEVAGRAYRIKGGDLFVTYPGEWHGTGRFPEQKGELYWMIIRVNKRGHPGKFLHFEGKQAQEWLSQLKKLPRHFKGNRLLKDKLEKIFEAYPRKRDPFSQITMQHFVADYLLEVIGCSRQSGFSQHPDRLHAVDAFLREQLDEPVALEDLARVCGLSLSRFKAWFKEETGVTPLDYIMGYKIKAAQQMLRKGIKSVTDIAFETGFQNPQYFATVFKKFTGLTPSNYKNSVAAEGE
jgi:AraC-like DNA-binding protein